MRKYLRDIVRLLRPRQWIKNFAIFAAITFTGELTDPIIFRNVTYGFFLFCMISSSIYVINDLFDIEKDRLHPFKRFRPLAHGDVPVPLAILIAVLLISVSLFTSSWLSFPFFLITLLYLLLQFGYSLYLKHIAVIDILTLATGYIIRVYGGELLGEGKSHISVWFLLTTVALSLFLAVGKRRRELTLVSQESSTNIAAIRKTLSHYSERLLDVYLSIFATSTFITYSLFTFLGSSGNLTVTNSLLLPDYIPAELQKKWLMVTILPVVYGLMRYLQDIYEKNQGESPEKVIFSDKPLLASVVLWFFLVILIIYFIGA